MVDFMKQETDLKKQNLKKSLEELNMLLSLYCI